MTDTNIQIHKWIRNGNRVIKISETVQNRRDAASALNLAGAKRSSTEHQESTQLESETLPISTPTQSPLSYLPTLFFPEIPLQQVVDVRLSYGARGTQFVLMASQALLAIAAHIQSIAAGFFIKLRISLGFIFAAGRLGKAAIQYLLLGYLAFVTTFFFSSTILSLHFSIPEHWCLSAFCPITDSPTFIPSYHDPIFEKAFNHTQASFTQAIDQAITLIPMPYVLIRTESALRDAHWRVKYSTLPSRVELTGQLSNHLKSSTEVRGNLIEFIAKVGGTTQRISNDIAWSARQLTLIAEETQRTETPNIRLFPMYRASRNFSHFSFPYGLLHHATNFLLPPVLHSLLPFEVPFSAPPPIITEVSLLLFQLNVYVTAVASRIQNLIGHAAELHFGLSSLHDNLDNIYGLTIHDEEMVTEARADIEENRPLWARLWTQAGGSLSDLRVVERQAKLLVAVRADVHTGLTYLTNMLVALHAVEADMQNLAKALLDHQATGRSPEQDAGMRVPLWRFARAIQESAAKTKTLQKRWQAELDRVKRIVFEKHSHSSSNSEPRSTVYSTAVLRRGVR